MNKENNTQKYTYETIIGILPYDGELPDLNEVRRHAKYERAMKRIKEIEKMQEGGLKNE
jgi:hypothetical protein